MRPAPGACKHCLLCFCWREQSCNLISLLAELLLRSFFLLAAKGTSGKLKQHLLRLRARGKLLAQEQRRQPRAGYFMAGAARRHLLMAYGASRR